jgi:hypothetical protein
VGVLNERRGAPVAPRPTSGISTPHPNERRIEERSRLKSRCDAHVSCSLEERDANPDGEGEMVLGKLAKMVAYTKAPRATFAVMHPIKAAKYGAIYMLVRGVTRRG